MDDLVAWLRACIDEDERAALAANVKQNDPDWWVSPVTAAPGNYTVRSRRDNRPIARVQTLDGDDIPAGILDGDAVASHIARHDPARVLAEVKAKREIVRALEDQLRDDDTDETANWMLATLAAIYADRPGYREEWKVSEWAE
jgi:hypothetical protein